MTMHSDAGPALFFSATTLRSRDRALGRTVRDMVLAALKAPRRLFAVWVNRMMRQRMKRALYSMSDRLLADIGICRAEIDAAVDGFIPPVGRRSAR